MDIHLKGTSSATTHTRQAGAKSERPLAALFAGAHDAFTKKNALAPQAHGTAKENLAARMVSMGGWTD